MLIRPRAAMKRFIFFLVAILFAFWWIATERQNEFAPKASLRFNTSLNKKHAHVPAGTPAREVASILNDPLTPFVIIPSYWSQETTSRAYAMVERAVAQCGIVYDGDTRRWGINELEGPEFELAREFTNDVYLREIAEHFLGFKEFNAKALAGITSVGGKSGGGWHVDRPTRGIKALLYLTDMHWDSGPFQILVGRNLKPIRDKNDPKGRSTRYTETEVNRQVAEAGAAIKTVTGVKGTVILFDTSMVHRGSPCIGRGRASLTTYYETIKSTTVCQQDSLGKTIFKKEIP